MASATFLLEDTQATRKELSLLFQIEPKELDRVSHNGQITVELPNLLEDKALHVLISAVSNHGFQVSIDHSPVKSDPKTETASKKGSK